MAENMTAEAKKLKMDHGDVDKNAEFSPPIPKSEEGAKDDCDNCKVYKATNETLAVKILKVQNENEKLRGLIKDLLVEAGRDPGNLDHLLSNDHGNENFKAAQQALSTSVVLQNVFGYFDDLSLLRFRQVCKFWAEEASACLLIFKEPKNYPISENVPRAQVRLSYNSVENSLGKNRVGILTNLITLLENGVEAGRKFPCSSFTLTCPNLLPTVVPDAVEFLEKFGHLIKSLGLEFVHLQNSPLTNRNIAEGLKNVLFKWAPNIKHFHFKVQQWPQDDQTGLLNEDSLDSLPNLQVLGWHNTSYTQLDVYRDILRISPNLKILNHPRIAEVVQAKKADAIKEIEVLFSSTPLDLNPNLSLKSDHCFGVERVKMTYFLYHIYDRNTRTVTFPEAWRSNVQLLNKVLYNNKSCLTKLECLNLGPLAEIGLQVPVMPNLKTLDITTDFDSNLATALNVEVETFFRLFPKGLDVASTFPKLAHILWNLKISEDHFNRLDPSYPFLELPLLDTMGPLTSVRSLTFKIIDEKSVEFLRRIADYLPNIRKLTVHYNDRLGMRSFEPGAGCIDPAFPKILRIIWDLFQGLEEIHLLPCLKDGTQGVFLKDSLAQLMDSAITGLDLATVKQLGGNCSENSKFGETSKNVENVQDKDPEVPSIRIMKRLRYLKISLQSKNNFPILSYVSGTHGFGLMNNLAVVIESESEKSSVIDDPKGLMSRNVKFTQIPRMELDFSTLPTIVIEQ